MKIRIERVNSELQRQIAAVISHDLKDPRLGSGIVSVTKVSTTPDLKFAKVYVSVYSASEDERAGAIETLKRSRTFIRNRLKELVEIRLLPELNFVLDTSVDYGMHIDSILKTIDIPAEDAGDTAKEK